jgi:SEC-C motif-containing protein
VRCPCGAGLEYGRCCGPLHDGAPAATAEALMRSRYSAYALGKADHLFRTWHPRTRPDDVVVPAGTTWLGLEVLDVVDGGASDETGVVEFVARYREAGVEHRLHERSRFGRRAGRWMYVDGTVP